MNAINSQPPSVSGQGWNLVECGLSGNQIWAPVSAPRVSKRHGKQPQSPGDASGRDTPSTK